MKKTTSLGACALSLLLLAGCSDASADISDGSSVLFKVGDSEVTKENMYATMKSNGANTVLEEVTKVIVKKEVKTTPEMEEATKKALEDAKTSSGENFENYIKQNGFKDENDYYKNYLLLQQQQKALNKAYATQEFKKLNNKYHPVKVQIIYTTDEAKANSALSDVKAGKGFAEAAQEYGDTTNFNGTVQLVNTSTTGMSATVMDKIKTVKKDGTLIDSVVKDGTTNFYIVNVVNVNAKDFKDEAIQSLSEISTMSDEAMTYFLKKYDFAIYDIDIYNTINTSKPAYIVQD